MTFDAAQAAGVDLNLGQQLVIMLTLLITSKGIAAATASRPLWSAGGKASWRSWRTGSWC